MSLGPDAFHLALERPVETVLVDFLIFDEGVLGDQFAETLRVDEIILHAVLLLPARGARRGGDGKLELGMQPEEVVHDGAFAGTGRRRKDDDFAGHYVDFFTKITIFAHFNDR